MDIKNHVSMNVQKGDNNYSLIMPVGCPLGELYDVLFDMLKRVVAESTAAAQKAAPVTQPSTPTQDTAQLCTGESCGS